MAIFRNAAEAVEYAKSHMETKIATKNGAYRSGRTIRADGCVNHSTACAQPSVDVFFNIMNTESAQWGVGYLLGDFHKGEGRILRVLPKDCRNWGCASGRNGSWNNSRVQWEVCEPSGHTYSGGTIIGYDVKKNTEYFNRMWKMLVAFNVYAVKEYGYPVSHIADHAESYRAGYGSNHADMGHWLPLHGKNMSALRAEVEEILNSKASVIPEAVLDTAPVVDIPAKPKDYCHAWATEACKWAMDNKLFLGDSNGNYMFDMDATREQAVTIMMRYASMTGVDTSARCDISSFEDANDVSKFASNAMSWAVAAGVISGTSSSKLDPGEPMSRAMFARMLHNFVGKPKVAEGHPFEDVEDGKWYSDAIRWLYSQKIMLGVDGTSFNPSGIITREQIALALFRLNNIRLE